MAYIDSELAKRRVDGAPAQSSLTQRPGSPNFVREGETKKDTEVERQPAALGRLLEIDLGDEAKSVNVQRTDRATRRLHGEDVPEDVIVKAKKVRLGRDGKPWRGKKRRASDDIKRDQLVEDVMRENRCKYLFPLVHDTETLTVVQWKSMRNQLPSLRLSTTTKLQTTELQKLSGKSSWIECLPDRDRSRRLLHLQVDLGRRRTTVRKDQS